MAKNDALINKETLSYICQNKNVSFYFIAYKTKINENKVVSWLTNSDSSYPSIKQAKKIASCIHIPFAGLYMNKRDIPLKKIPDIKNLRTIPTPNCDDSALNIAVIDVLLEKDFLLNAYNELKIEHYVFSPTIPNTENIVEWAKTIREEFSLELEKQIKLKSPRKLYLYLREQIEHAGVFVQCFTDVSVSCARGFAIFDSELPIIGINDEDSTPAKTFTLIHELVHLIKRESSYCNNMISYEQTSKEEIFCNAVAGELLVPKESLKDKLKSSDRSISQKDIKDLADNYSVSRDVIIRRLFDLSYIDKNKYNEFERDKEKRKNARQNGIKSDIPRNISMEAINRTSSSVIKILYSGYYEDIYSKQDIARHLGIAQKHIDNFLKEVSKWDN